MNNNEIASFIWKIADLLRNTYKSHLYKSVILPMTVLRRLDCVLEKDKKQVLQLVKKWDKKGQGVLEGQIKMQLGLSFYNGSLHSFATLGGEPNRLADNLRNYIQGFSANIYDILKHFEFEHQINKLADNNLLFPVFQEFAQIDLHPDQVPNETMGTIFEELLRKFNELSNEKAGEHFTPREVIHLMVDLLFAPDEDTLTKKDKVWTLLDPACGTGGMLSGAVNRFKRLNPDADLYVYGQDCNDESFAVCGSDMLMKGDDISHIAFGNSFTQDQFKDYTFDYMIANPPFGVKWEAEQQFIKNEHEQEGYGGRFGAGLPSVDDGSLLFLQHMIRKVKEPDEGGSRIAIVFNGSPLFTGKAGGGESEIRKWILEHDWLEAIIALPDQLFYNTGIATYIWILSNRKAVHRKNKIRLVNGVSFFGKMHKSLGHKRNEIDKANRKEIVRLYDPMDDGGKENENVRVFDIEEFGYTQITVERPLRLSFAVTSERMERLVSVYKKNPFRKHAEKIQKEPRALQEEIEAALLSLKSKGIVRNRDEWNFLMEDAFHTADLKLPSPVKKAIGKVLAERDESADVCKNAKGEIEADAKLRDYERVPLKDDIDEYMKREVIPHVPDAWEDEKKRKIGYEINFNRYFYEYEPPRSLEAIEKELRQTEGEIEQLLKELA